ncbi:MAG: V4R domain-containing protein [Anaerolineales bacterium]
MPESTTETKSYFYPNRIGRVILVAMEKELGRERLDEVLRAGNLTELQRLPPNNLNRKFRFEWVAGLQAATESVFGAKAGRKMNHRIGAACFNTGLKEFDPLLGIADLPFRLMPLGMKFRVGLDVFARVFNQFSDQVVRIQESEDSFNWIIERCPVCWGRETDAPCCGLAQGILEESIFWGTGGRRYQIEETQCVAMGADACVFAISKSPLD